MGTYRFGKRYSVILDEETLSLRIDTPDGGWRSVRDKQPYFVDKDRRVVLLATAGVKRVNSFETGVGEGVHIALSGFGTEEKPYCLSLELSVWQNRTTGELVFELIPVNEEKQEILEIFWPAALERLDGRPGYSVFPMMQGMLLDDHSQTEAHTFMSGMFFSREATMPWWGQYTTDSGYMAIVDTPWDARLDYHHLSGRQTSIAVGWVVSLGKINYRRILKIRFQKQCNYVTMAKEFRNYVRYTTGLTTLKEKMQRNSLVKEMLGRPVINTDMALFHVQPESPYFQKDHPEKNHVLHTFKELGDRVEEIHGRGLENAYYHIDGWGRMGYDNLHPDILPPCEEAGGTEGLRCLLRRIRETGGLSALHDQYRDYYTRADSFDEANAVQFADGDLYCWCEWPGGDQRALCAQLAPDYIDRNYDWLKEEKICPDGVYLDVFSVIELDECDNPHHRMSRKECMEARIRCMESIRSRGMLVSSEEPMYGFADHMDLVHHGPYLYAFYELYHMDTPMMPVPLFNLVYHDCLMIPWYLGYNGWGLPPHESGFLHGLLNGGLPMVSFEPDDQEIGMAQEMCRLHRQVGDVEMTEHQFLENGGQRTVFADGTEVTVDFSAGRYEICWPDGGKTEGAAKPEALSSGKRE